ncbi:MAG: filamentous hemagglutinin family protein, partial [Pseudomonadota bacterium]
SVDYESQGGTINLAYNALTDVSAGSAQGNAGTIGIRNPHGITVIEGNLAGTSRLGHGGTFILDMNSFGSTLATSETAVSSLMGKLSKGGFNNRIDIRARKGDVQLAKDVTAHEFRLSVDEGNVKTDAQINASGAEGGGRVEIYAGQNLTLSENTTILAKGTGTDADGGEVILGNGGNDGFMDLAGAVIDVSSVNGIGGNIYLRVPLNQGETEVNLNMNASLVGASDIVVEGVKTYKDTTISDTTISDTTAWKTNAHHLMNNYGDTITARLVAEAGGSLDGFSFIPGIEVQSIGNLSLNTDLDMTSWRFGTQKVAAALTLRAANDLNINKSIVDHPTNTGNLTSETAAASTNISLSAGASLASSDIFAVEQKKGNFKLKDEKMIYTEGGNINFASGNDTLIGKIYSKSTDYMTNNGMKYNLASYTGNIRGAASNDLLIDSGVIQTATGDITLDVVGDLTLNQRTNQDIGGSIRTTGQPGYFENAPYPKSAQQTWGYLYNSGGDILIRAGADVTRTLAGKVTTEHKSDAWDTRMMGFDFSDYPNSFEYFYTLCANYAGLNATQGIATMGGGDLTVLAGGNFFSAAGTFQEGDMTISVGGNLNGRFLTKSGEVELSTLGSFGTLSDDQVVEAYDSQISVTAQGNITLGTVLNPTITKNNFNSTFQWDLQYTEKTALSLAARRGNVELTGQSDSDFGFKATRSHVLPANLSINAGQDIMIGTDFYMTPSSTGFLELSAGRDITGKSSTGKDNFIYMSDLDPDEVYGNHNDPDGANVSLMGDLGNPNLHSAGVLHKDDYVLAVVEAGNDISNIGLAIPKAATIRAGQDIINLNYSGQNLRKTDETRIMAGRDIYYLVDREKNNTIGILAGGPGLTVVQAGNNIDLGRSDGIQSVGSLFNSYLPAGENDLMVIAGITQWYTADKIKTFFDQLRNAGTLYAKARADGDIELAEQILADVRNTRIDPFLAENEEIGGDINLVNSKVYTTGGTGDILALAAGEINVGLSGVTPPPITGKKSTDNGNSGFYTTSGGGLRLFAQRDINVNESRVMTFSGGDIDIWSDTGNINAGRGSKAAVASTSSYVVEDEKTGVLTVQYDPPAVGSGIRATASTVEEAGDINAFAPGGDIDAGEAGISGKNVTLSAKKVLNAQNIQTTGISIGFAKPAESSASIAGFSGGGGLADGGMLNEASSLLATVKERLNEAAPEGYSIEPKWVDVEVIEFDKDDEDKKNDNGKIEAS